jgi:hypothetical protein
MNDAVLLSLPVKTESLALSSAEVGSLTRVALEADLLNGVPSLRAIQPTVRRSTIETNLALGTDRCTGA